MLQLLSPFELGSLHPCFHDSLTIIDPPYTLTAKANCGTLYDSPVADYINVTTLHECKCHLFMLTVNGEVHESEYNGYKLIATRVIYIAHLGVKDLILVHEDGLVKLGQQTFQLQVPYGIRTIYRGWCGGLFRVVVETMDNYLYIVREEGDMMPKKLSLKSITITTHDTYSKWYVYTLKDDSIFGCRQLQHI
jgi:hypothetical protein